MRQRSRSSKGNANNAFLTPPEAFVKDPLIYISSTTSGHSTASGCSLPRPGSPLLVNLLEEPDGNAPLNLCGGTKLVHRG